MWELYDELIAGIPPEAIVDDMACGVGGTYVCSGAGIGVSNKADETWRAPEMTNKSIGMPLRELAECAKSWSFEEANLGIAAINAWYNDITRLRALGLNISDAVQAEDRSADPFITLQREMKGKNVTTIGHFPYIDQLLAPICNLSVVEKFYPQEGDYPEQAADYLIPNSEYVLIASFTLVEKSLPRFLKLCASGAHVTIVGMAAPVTPILHRYGVNDIAGFVVKNIDAAKNICLGYGGNIHSTGQKINYRAENIR
ncbi:MAG: DUF364 domain-containing protein [Oscillospiraceae bacterium]|nr:DUF364 domain-containing protein [Oscillospiraceae bacterium]